MKPIQDFIDDRITAHTMQALNKKLSILKEIEECLDDIALIRGHIEELKEQLVLVNLKLNFKQN